MMRRVAFMIIAFLCGATYIFMSGCQKDPVYSDNTLYNDEAYIFEKPFRFPDMVAPEDNPLTVAKVDLGRLLFYDKKLSIDGSMSCGTCHSQELSFADEGAKSINVAGEETKRNASPLINLAWAPHGYFWDGRVLTLEEAVLDAIVAEQHIDWGVSLADLSKSERYETAFKKAFQDGKISQENTIQAIASFIRIIVSSDSKLDRFFRGEELLTPQELSALETIFNTEKGDCFHCHAPYPLMTDNDFHNNAIEPNIINPADFPDYGFGEVTGHPNQNGWFKTPTLRNLIYTAPYMHDGRFSTIDEVIEHYSTGLHYSPTADPLMKKVNQGGLQLTQQEKEALKALLLTMTDDTFINNPEYADPF